MMMMRPPQHGQGVRGVVGERRHQHRPCSRWGFGLSEQFVAPARCCRHSGRPWRTGRSGGCGVRLSSLRNGPFQPVKARKNYVLSRLWPFSSVRFGPRLSVSARHPIRGPPRTGGALTEDNRGLTVKGIERLKRPGRHRDERGLYLRSAPAGLRVGSSGTSAMASSDGWVSVRCTSSV